MIVCAVGVIGVVNGERQLGCYPSSILFALTGALDAECHRSVVLSVLAYAITAVHVSAIHPAQGAIQVVDAQVVRLLQLDDVAALERCSPLIGMDCNRLV